MPNKQVKIRCYNYREHPNDIITELQGILILEESFKYSVLL